MSADRHPALKLDGFVIQTEPLKEVAVEFSRYLQTGELTLVVYAPSRHGKTAVARFIRDQLIKNGTMVVFWANLERDPKQEDEREKLWMDLLRPLNPALTATVQRPYEELFKLAVTEADRIGTDFIVFIIDEAQNLTVAKLGALKKLVDDLRDRELSPFVLQFGQLDILARAAFLKRQLLHDLVDRFSLPQHRLRGLRLNEISAVLSYYDTTVWPVGSEVTYTSHFLPGPWKRGWRLLNQEHCIMACFEALAARVALDPNDIGIKFVISALKRFLLTAQSSKETDDATLQTLLGEAVSHCGLAEAFQMVGDAEAAARQKEWGSRRKGAP